MLTVLQVDANKTWANASLRDRAYFGAWFKSVPENSSATRKLTISSSNAYTMFYLNVSNPKTKPYAQRFQYLDSTVGKTFALELPDFPSFNPRYDQLVIHGGYAGFLVRLKIPSCLLKCFAQHRLWKLLVREWLDLQVCSTLTQRLVEPPLYPLEWNDEKFVIS